MKKISETNSYFNHFCGADKCLCASFQAICCVTAVTSASKKIVIQEAFTLVRGSGTKKQTVNTCSYRNKTTQHLMYIWWMVPLIFNKQHTQHNRQHNWILKLWNGKNDLTLEIFYTQKKKKNTVNKHNRNNRNLFFLIQPQTTNTTPF